MYETKSETKVPLCRILEAIVGGFLLFVMENQWRILSKGLV